MATGKITKSKALYLFAMIAFPVLIFSLQFLSNAQVKELIDEAQVYKKEAHLLDLQAINLGQTLKLEKIGEASYYGREFHQRRTASGERYDMHDFTAAHKKLPFGTILKITNLKNGESVLARVNDRGPFVRNREIDLSYQTAKEIGGLGVAKVRMEGFVPGIAPVSHSEDENYFYGYSICNDLVCVPAKTIKNIDSSYNFNEAYAQYKKLVEEQPERELFIFVNATSKGKDKKKPLYIVGELRSEMLNRSAVAIN